MNYLDKVIEFHSVFRHPINEGLENRDLNTLRISLLFEELEELALALGERDYFEKMCHNVSIEPKGDNYEDRNYVEVVDAYADIMYILAGSIISNGLEEIFNEAFRRVHESNMSKACKTIEEAEETVRAYLKDGVRAYFEEFNGLYIVYRKQDNKVLKSINYKKVDLNDLI